MHNSKERRSMLINKNALKKKLTVLNVDHLSNARTEANIIASGI
jgi:hypothetical protein